MKRVLGMLLVLVAIMSVSVFAETVTYTPEDDGTYNVSYTEGTASNYYALLVVEGVYAEDETPVISEDTVLYIDQGTANSNGDVSFNGWIPKNEEPATVYLGGAGASPILLGYLGENTFFVSGTVSTDSGTTYEATVTLTNGEDEFTVTSANGAYSIEVPEGTYTFKVNVKNHLSYTDNDFAVNADVSGKDVAIIGGDTSADDKIDFDDIAIIVNNYNASFDDADVTGDGTVDFDDLSSVVNNYNAVAVVD
ncbi:MAG: hypothetical protein E7600_00415 [Ruminococcaceae bacterium]|nr:hypothetical protein [Oscillospiraceae bacterium]